MTGCWPPSLAAIIENDMFIKELLPVTIAILLLHIAYPHYIFGSALDNAGVVSRINAGSCKSPLGRRLMTAIADALFKSNGYTISDWNNRDQIRAVHADTLSKLFSPSQWSDLQDANTPPWIFDLFIKQINSGETIRTSIRIPRLAEAIPHHHK